MTSLLKHVVATCVLSAALGTTAFALYFVLLGYSFLTPEPDSGGPLALPMMVIVAGSIGIAAGPLVLLPVIALSERICRPVSVWRRLAQIPIASGLLSVVVSILALSLSLQMESTPGESAMFVGVLVAVALLGLGVYWWTIRIMEFVGSRLSAWRRSRPTHAGT